MSYVVFLTKKSKGAQFGMFHQGLAPSVAAHCSAA